MSSSAIYAPGAHANWAPHTLKRKQSQKLAPSVVWEHVSDHSHNEIYSSLVAEGAALISNLSTYLRFHQESRLEAVQRVTRKILAAVIQCINDDPKLAVNLIPALYDYFVKLLYFSVRFDEQWYEIINFSASKNHSKAVDFIKKIISRDIGFPIRYYHLHPGYLQFGDGDSPAHKSFDKLNDLERLYDSGFALDTQNAKGQTPLYLACGKDALDHELIKFFILRGSNPTKATGDGSDSFHNVFRSLDKPSNKYPMLKLFLQRGFIPSFAKNPVKRYAQVTSVPSSLQRLAEYFFNAGETFCKTIDCFPDDNVYGNVGMVQGHPKFRRRACQIDPALFHPSSLPFFQSLNPPVYEKLAVKRFAHNMSLKMMPEDIRYEGFSESFIFPMLTSTIRALRNKGSLFNAADWEWIANKLNEAVLYDRLKGRAETVAELATALSQRYQTLGYDDIITLGTGYDWHFLGWVLLGNFPIFINRQRRTLSSACLPDDLIEIYYTPDRSGFTPELMTNLIEQRYERTTNTYFTKAFLERRLKLRKIATWKVKPQKTGNCTLANSKGIALVISAIRHLMKVCTPTDITLQNPFLWEAAFKAVTPSYKIVTQEERENSAEIIFMEVDRLVAKQSWSQEDRDFANSYYNVLLYTAISFSHASLDTPVVKRMNPEYRRAIWDRIIKLNEYLRTLN